MTMQRWAVLAAMGFVAACGNSSSGAGTGAESGSGSLADTFCAKIEPCCASAKLPTDGKTCQELFAALASSDNADPSMDEACVAALQAESQDAFCMDYGSQLTACMSALSKTGTAQPGAACANDDDCAPSSAGTVSCVFTDTGDSSVCEVAIKGQAGSSPCIGTTTPIPGGSETVSTTNGTPPAQGYLCSTADGLYCDSTSSSCLALKGTGASCESDSECVTADACVFGTDASSTEEVCGPRVALGGACSTDSSCVSGAYCPEQTCVALLAEGAACTTDEACISGSCESSVCGAAGALTLTLFCGSATTH